jgi:hypothetical protein
MIVREIHLKVEGMSQTSQGRLQSSGTCPSKVQIMDYEYGLRIAGF